MRRSVARLLTLLAVGAPADRLGAQQVPVPLDSVRVSVISRSGELLGSASRAVDVIDRELILGGPATNVVEALQWGFGVELMPRSPALSDVAIRGSSFEQVLVLVNGARVRDSQTGHFNLNLAVPLDQVERIEILRGPAASLYGSDAMGGVINIVTRTTGEATSVTLGAGSFDRRSLSANRSQAVGPLYLDIAGSLEESDGHRPGTDFDMRLARASIRYPLGGADHLSAEVAHAVRKFGAGGFYGDYPAFETTRTTTAVLSGRAFSRGSLLVEPSLRMRRNSDDFILYRDEPERYRNRHSTLQLGADLIARAVLTPILSVAAGLHGTRDEVDSNSLGDHDEATVGASVELSAATARGLNGSVGLRADRLPDGKTELNPSASAGWWLHESIRIRSSVGRAHRSPTWTERYYRDPVNEGSPDLLAENAWSADAGVDLHPSATVRLSVSAFLRDAENLIDWARSLDVAETVWRTRNVNNARFEGIEAELELADVRGTRIRASGYWLSVSSSAAPGFESKYALRPLVETLTLSADRGFGPVEVFLRGARERRSGEDHYFRLDGRAAVRVRDLRLFVDVQNGTDEEYPDISQIPAAGRSVSVGLELRPLRR